MITIDVPINFDQETAVNTEKSRLFSWLAEQAEKRHISLNVYQDLARTEGNYLYIPVFVDNKRWGAVKKAHFLQQVEDGWNYQKPEPVVKVLLIPTKIREDEANLATR